MNSARKNILSPRIAVAKGGTNTTTAPTLRFTLWSVLGAAFAVALLAYLTEASGVRLLMAPLGASCILTFGVPESPFAQPRNIIGGHLVAAFIGVAVAQVVGVHWWSLGIASGIALGVMQHSKTIHPPAGATPIVIMTTGAGWSFLLTPVFVGSVLIVLCAVVVNNLSKARSYPTYWL